MNAGTNHSELSYDNIAHDIDVLEKNAGEYPFSSLTQYLLLRHYRKSNQPGFQNLLKKTALYFNNYHWLQFQLSQIETKTTENKFVNETGYKTKSHDNQNHFAIATDEQINMHQNSRVDTLETKKFIPDTQDLGFHIENYYEEEKQANGETYSENSSRHEEEYIPDSQTLGTRIDNFPEYEVQQGYENVAPEIIQDEVTIPPTEELGTHLENIPETERAYNTEVATEIIHSEEMDSHTEMIKPAEQIAENVDSFDNKPTKIISADQISKIENTGVEPLAFEPLHTVDYFASQGIRITEESLKNDKLGAQMKSFTDWLKSMKKLHTSKLPEQNSLAEDIIQSAAEVSNIDTEVLTEAMAEVLIKQDKKEKAIEMYTKLSLINTSKSAYFTAKIESIKST